MKNNIAKVLNQPGYWIEAINGILYNAIVDYMEKNELNRTQLAEILGISKGRVSQILNNGQINFSIEKIVEISLKIDKYPIFSLEDSNIYLEKLNIRNETENAQPSRSTKPKVLSKIKERIQV